MSSLDLLLGTSSAQEAPGVHQQTTQEGTDASASQDTLPNFANALDLILNDGVASDTVSKEDQNGGNGNNNSSSNGATSNSDDFFDFFETSQQSQQQQQQPQTQLVDIGEASEKCSLEMLKEVLDVLKVASHKHNRTLLEEGKLEDYVQETILGAWDISTHTKVYKFYCSNCDKVLQHTNKIREAKLSPETLNKAIDYLNRCLSLLTRGVYLSMYEQTLSEVTFAHDIQVFVASERSSQSHLKAALDMVFDVLREASHSNTAQTLSGNTTAFLRRTALALARLLQALDPSDATDRYLQGRLAEVSEGFSWGAALFNFDGFLEQIVRGDWLNTTLAKMMVVAGGGTGGGDCSVDESQALHLFARVPWAGIDKFSEDELHTFVLGSLEKFLRNALEKGLAKLGVLCAEVAVYACNLYPNLTKKVVSMLTTATLPNAKIALTSVLPFLPFNSLSYKHLCSVYSKMFNFDVDKYWTLQGQSKNVVRNGFGNFLFQNFSLINDVKEQRPGILSHKKDKNFLIGSFYNKMYGYLNFFPHFIALTEIALASFKHTNTIDPYNNSRLDLINITADELCFFAFVFSVGTTHQTRPILDHIKSDAFKNLVILVNEYPALFYRVVWNIGLYAADVNPAYATSFVDSCRPIVQNLVPDTNMGVCLGTLLAHTSLPATIGALPPVSSTQATYEYAKRVFLMEPPTRPMTRTSAAGAAAVGGKLLEALNWSLAVPAMKAQLMFVLVALRKFVSDGWFVQLLTRHNTVFVGPYDIAFVKTLLALKPQQFVSPCDVVYVQAKILLSLAEDHFYGEGSKTKFDAKWFAGSGFFECLEFLHKKGKLYAVVAFAAAAWNVVLTNTDALIRRFDSIVGLLRDNAPALVKLVGLTVRKAAPGPSAHKTISTWIMLLGPKAQDSPACMELCDLIYHYTFLHGLPLFSAPKLFRMLGAPNDPLPLTTGSVNSNNSSNGGGGGGGQRRPCIWLALACALDARARGGVPGLAECFERLCVVASAVCASSDCALMTPADTTIIWNRFFRAYFECGGGDGGNSNSNRTARIPGELRIAINAYFAAASDSESDDSNSDPLKCYYRALSGWKEAGAKGVFEEGSFAKDVLPAVKRKCPSPLEQAEDGEGSADAAGDSVAEANGFLLRSNVRPFLVMGLEERRAAMLKAGFLPPKEVKNEAYDTRREEDLARKYENDVRSTVRDVLSIGNDSGSGRVDQIVACTQLPALKRLFDCLEAYTTQMAALSELNKDYTRAAATMYANVKDERTMRMMCTCKRSHVFKAPVCEVVEGAGSKQVGPNRSEYNKAMHALLASSKAIAYVMALLRHVVTKALQQLLPPGEHSDRLANIFFALVPLVVHKNLPPKSPVAADVVSLLRDIAERAGMATSPDLQALLFGVLLDLGTAKSYAAYTPVAHFTSAGTLTSKKQTQQQQQQQQQSSGADESACSLVELYNPACYLVNDGRDNGASRALYAAQIEEICRSETLGQAEKALLLGRFASTFGDAVFRVIVSDQQTLGAMLGLLRSFSRAAVPLVPLFTDLCGRLVRLDFPRFAPLVADILVSSSDEVAAVDSGSGSASQAELDILRGAFDAVDSAHLPLAQITQLLRVLTRKLPLRPAPRNAVLAVASKLFVVDVWLSDFERCAAAEAAGVDVGNGNNGTGPALNIMDGDVATITASGGGGGSIISSGNESTADSLKMFTAFVKAFLGCCTSPRADGPSVGKLVLVVEDLARALLARNNSNGGSGDKNNVAVVAVMNVVYTLVVPKLIELKMCGSGGSDSNRMLADLFGVFPPAYVTGSWRFWNKATIEYMAAVIFGNNAEAANLYVELVKGVDWPAFLAYLHGCITTTAAATTTTTVTTSATTTDEGESHQQSQQMLLLAVLRFFLLFRTINPRIFDQDVWDALTPAPIARPDASSPGFDWSVLRSGDFAALFDGSFFAGVLKECAANMAAAPCGLLDSLLWVAEIAKTLHFDAVAAASREARTLAFLAVENAATRTFWLLPGGDVDRILLEVELSFCAYLAGFPAGACDAEFAEVVRDTLSFCAPENVRILTGTAAFATQTLVNAKTKEPSVADEVQRRTKKYAAIVFQFPKQSSQRVALEFVAQAFPVFGKDVPFAISFLEEAVRAYLLTASSADTAEATDEEENDNDNDKAEGESGESEGNNRGSALGRRMALPPIPLDAFLQACAAADATLCVYALCERFRYIGKMGKFLDCLVPLVTKFSPHKIYQYDIIAVWMAPLCALADDAWVPTQAEATRITQLAKTLRDFATDIININGFILGASGYESTFTRLRFVALSSCIFYLKLLLQKDDKKTQGNASDSDEGSDGGVYDSLLLSKVEEDHAEAMNQLVKLKATNDTADLKQFYKITKKFNDSSYTWESFKKDVTSTLCPMAPYLQNL